jgi:hypothetical protein
MIRYILAVIVLLSILGAGTLWLTNIIIKAERAKTLERAVELVVERDKINAKLKTATPSDICARLGGRMLEDGECG